MFALGAPGIGKTLQVQFRSKAHVNGVLPGISDRQGDKGGNAVEGPDVAIRSSLTGRDVYSIDGRRRIIPLLNPLAENVPFGMALELWGFPELPCQPESLTSNSTTADDLYELDYVILGNGKLTDQTGSLDILKAGDSVIMPYKGACCEAMESDDCQDGESSDWQFALLRLLLPSDFVSSPSTFSDVRVAGDAYEEWTSSAISAGHLGAGQVYKLLSGMQQSVRIAPTVQAKDVKLKHLWPTQSTSHHDHALDVVKRSLEDLPTFQLPNQTNRLALVFDPTEEDIPFTFGVEIFEPNHHTQPHVHNTAHELFFILSGTGCAFCNGHSFPVEPGDTVVFPPGSLHGLDNGPHSKMYCLELMLPNEMFAEFVKNGQPRGGLRDEDLCSLIAVGCS